MAGRPTEYADKIPSKHKIIYLEDIEFMGDARLHPIIKIMWENNAPLKEISKAIKEPIDKTFIICWHLSREGIIERRSNGVWGDLIV